jgi:hypothetical protein
MDDDHRPNTDTPPPSPPADLSPRVVQLARMVDNLPPGKYSITIEKQEIRAQDWRVEISRTEFIVNLSRRPPTDPFPP